jgi:hypothetical protein
LDARVSAINGTSLAQDVASATPKAHAGWRFESWFGLLLAALVLLAIEWWTFHRRLTV